MSAPSFSLTLQTLFQVISRNASQTETHFDDYNSWVDSDAPVHVYAAAQCLLKQPPTVPIEDALQFLFDTVEHGLSWGHYVSLFETCLCFRRLNDSRAV